MCSIRIHNPGLLTTIQDAGRIGYGQYGIPAGGAMDTLSLQFANILVGNDRYEAAMEITFMGPKIEFDSNLIISITGGDISPRINNKEIEMYSTVYVNRGDILSFGQLKRGCRSYLAVSGGFKVESLMESKSTYLRGKIGGYKGRKLKIGDIVPVDIEKSKKYLGVRKIPKELIPVFDSQYIARVIMGPEDERFTQEGIDTFLNSEYTLTNQCDRMGYRLGGPKIVHEDGADIISGGITFGAIQIPGHGEPIIMMADRQTTGGYTKIANVISVDLPYLAQLKTGDRIKFEKISIVEAQKLIKERERKLIRCIEDMKENTIIKDVKRMSNYLITIDGKEFNIGVQEFI
ncbi:biotin-dependent carboxyltransferase family protein [Wukongibacter baidiensis]|uniref:5-oxoprolinase subunit C family protein n=1 Tax=Wukongibacter baidiensis TaxID=1723361 RepID=UPI003D7F4B51